MLSVGTSTPPLEQCLGRLRPRRAVFLCSQDTQAKVREILSHVRVGDFQPERDVVVLSQTADEASALSSEIDQSHRVYERCRDLFNTLRQHQTGAGSGWITPVAPRPWPRGSAWPRSTTAPWSSR